MNMPNLENIRRVLAVGAVHIKVTRIPYPPHWRSGQQLSDPPTALGHQVKQQRLELHLLQADLAKALQVSVVSVSNWERGINQPSRRTRRRIQDLSELHRGPNEGQDGQSESPGAEVAPPLLRGSLPKSKLRIRAGSNMT